MAPPRGPGRDRPPEEGPRHAHVAAQIRRSLQLLLAKGLNDPRIRGLVSITGVDLSPDHTNARVLVSVLPGEHGPLAVAGLRHAAGRLHGQVGRALRLRRVPRLDFELDDSLKKQARLDASLQAPDGSVDEDATGGPDQPEDGL